MTNRFEGVQSLYGADLFNTIQNAHIAVIGVGGVGSWSCESLARSGVGELTIIDMDEICISNTNRQVHTLNSTTGQMKVDALGKRLLDINPDLKLNIICDFFTQTTIESILTAHHYTYIIDAIDSLKNKALLIGECHQRNIPIITVGAAAGMKDASKIIITDLNKTINDKLFKRLRRILKFHYPEFKKFNKKPFGIYAVHSTETVHFTNTVPEQFDEIRNCKTGFGSACHVTAALGFNAAGKVINEITSS